MTPEQIERRRLVLANLGMTEEGAQRAIATLTGRRPPTRSASAPTSPRTIATGKTLSGGSVALKVGGAPAPRAVASGRVTCSVAAGAAGFELPENLRIARDHLRGMVGLDGKELDDGQLAERLMALVDLFKEMGITHAELQRRAAAGPLILASAYPGRNQFERTMTMLASTRPELRRASRDRLFDVTRSFLAEHGSRVV